MSAMIGALMLLLEWTGTAVGLSEGYHGPVLTLALGLILIPAYLSADHCTRRTSGATRG